MAQGVQDDGLPLTLGRVGCEWMQMPQVDFFGALIRKVFRGSTARGKVSMVFGAYFSGSQEDRVFSAAGGGGQGVWARPGCHEQTKHTPCLAQWATTHALVRDLTSAGTGGVISFGHFPQGHLRNASKELSVLLQHQTFLPFGCHFSGNKAMIFLHLGLKGLRKMAGLKAF